MQLIVIHIVITKWLTVPLKKYICCCRSTAAGYKMSQNDGHLIYALVHKIIWNIDTTLKKIVK